MENERLERGQALLRQLYGDVGERVLSEVDDIAPDLRRYVAEFAFGDVFSRPGLDLRSREIATIAALTTLGNAQPALRAHIIGALSAGCTKTEVVETILQMAVYAGFPAALNGMDMAAEAFELWDRKQDREGR